MKKLLFFIALTPFLFSCEDKEPVDYAVISGTITNADFGQLAMLTLDGELLKEIPVKENGHFEDTLEVNQPGTYRLAHQSRGFSIFLAEGYDLQINYDTEDFMKSISFSGKGSEFNNYLQDARRIWSDVQGEDIEVFYQLQKEDFKEKILKIQEGQQQLLASVKNIPENLRNKESRNIGYFGIAMLQVYNQIPDNERFDNQDFVDVFEGYRKMNYANQEDFEYSTYYRTLVHTYYNDKAQELAKKDDLEGIQAFFKTIKEIPADNIRNVLLYNRVSRELAHTDDLDGLYKQYMELSTDEDFNNKIVDSYTKLKKITRGSPSPKFVGYENHDGGETSLDDLKGDYLYLDIWATWCAPCLNEIPALKKLEEEYQDSNIKFVSISIDQRKDHEKWKQMVTDKGLKGVQLLADNAWQSDFVQDYQIQAIPRFILLDPEGNIVTDRAPYPSDKGLIRIFEEEGI